MEFRVIFDQILRERELRIIAENVDMFIEEKQARELYKKLKEWFDD